jgi:WW domain-binding protein 2
MEHHNSSLVYATAVRTAAAAATAPAAPRDGPRSTIPAQLDSDDESSWVMLAQNGDIVRLPWEHIQHTKGPRISLELCNAQRSHGRASAPFSLKCSDGKVYITTQRVSPKVSPPFPRPATNTEAFQVIYMPTKPTAEFKSFAVPIMNVEDSRAESGWMGIGAWCWHAFAKPVPQGGIPPDVVRLEIKIYFNEGGIDQFRQRFEEMKERLYHIREIERETGQRITVPDEPLPAYEARASTSSATASSTLAPPGAGGPVPRRSDSSASTRRPPDEPPPNYDEAQAQTISMRLEDHIREEADLDDTDRDERE